MTNRTALSPLACTAIAAVLAIAPATAFAQETAAQSAVPDPTPAVVVAPAPIIIPEMRAAPVVQVMPEVSAAPEPAAQTRAVTAPIARAAPRQTARPVAAVAAAPVAAQPVSAAPIADPAPVAAPVAVTPVTASAAAPQSAAVPADENTTALGLGLLGLVALGGAGAYAGARRRRRVAEPEVLYSDERLVAPAPTLAKPAPSLATTAWAPAVATSAAAPLMFERQPLAASTAGSVIPAGPLPTGPALAELFERMVRATPDADNPFKGDKRRRARVRWLMKQHEYRLRDAAGQNAEDRFDFRTFAASTKQAEPARTRREVVPA